MVINSSRRQDQYVRERGLPLMVVVKLFRLIDIGVSEMRMMCW